MSVTICLNRFAGSDRQCVVDRIPNEEPRPFSSPLSVINTSAFPSDPRGIAEEPGESSVYKFGPRYVDHSFGSSHKQNTILFGSDPQEIKKDAGRRPTSSECIPKQTRSTDIARQRHRIPRNPLTHSYHTRRSHRLRCRIPRSSRDYRFRHATLIGRLLNRCRVRRFSDRPLIFVETVRL